ncbi:adenosylcobinamide-GDP ribazoletransferase [Photobacterium halotolerans]|uniref:Adenosylcobinamide-GDP ribazoletransferase n=1 Tax=Photobacterium halotolerans TaxID=265726 RepID=A0A7X4WH46_9GAMM|nr:adenosylcobinamide-GDP ribazoletransferase [Photobacterium halotolerans]NAW67330.1 adenosylcobinamide-GDP ribazoletransferase [Photobacterium halotolerans]NAW86105.1 adenosylcobinamide-GDP ribazoletransferase [Photobacterium halotolerans]NAX47095.1 adenosylcobinamide-GDP ribazoletransferase [Photobacterium halotolerans]
MFNLRYQYQLFCLAVSFFSRLPIPASTPYSDERMNRAGRYFALVGLVLGALCAVAYSLSETWLPAQFAVFITMVFSLLLTGAFHEDGLTDMADGIGGGMTTERRLIIMKDSRIGTYGAATLTMALLGKFIMLSYLAEHTELAIVLIIAYTLSRTVAASLIFDMPYVSDASTSKSKPLANAQTVPELLFSVATGVLVCLVLAPDLALVLIVAAVLFRIGFKAWLNARLGGFTGDCLGAAQQLMELLIYLILIASVHNQWG